MHEISLCESILQVLEEQAQAQHFSTVKNIRLEIGKLSCVEIDALRFGFDVVMKGSLAENATLEIIRVPGEAYCFDCGKRVQINDRLEPCPDCGGVTLSPTGGDDMRIKDLEVV